MKNSRRKVAGGTVPTARLGFTLVELLVVVAIVGVLIALLLPSLSAVRERSRRTRCEGNLHQIGVALQGYHEVRHAFPPGCVEWRPMGDTTQRQLAWSAFLLPHLGEDNTYALLDLSKAFDAAENADGAATAIAVYLCPSSPHSEPTFDGRGRCDYGGIYGERISGPNEPPKGTMLFDQQVALAHITDGPSHTIIVSEDTGSPDGQWINGRNLFDQAFAINAAPAFENDIRSEHPGGAVALFADGNVHFLQEDLDLSTLGALCTRAGSEAVTGFD